MFSAYWIRPKRCRPSPPTINSLVPHPYDDAIVGTPEELAGASCCGYARTGVDHAQVWLESFNITAIDAFVPVLGLRDEGWIGHSIPIDASSFALTWLAGPVFG